MQTKTTTAAALGIMGCIGTAQADEPVTGYAPMQQFTDRAVVDGTSTLTRHHQGAAFTLSTRALQNRNAYTVWWVVFNNPELCESACECGAVDLDNPAVEPGQFWATGRVADRFGQADFAGGTGVGELPAGEDQAPHPIAMSPLLDPLEAEIHLVVRGHGRHMRRHLEEQLTTLNGGCPPNECANAQFSIHRSPTCEPVG